MPVTTEATITVGTGDLRRALTAVTCHAEPNKTGDTDAENRVRFSFGADELLVIASNGSTAVMAAVALDDDTRREKFAIDDGPYLLDLPPRACRLLLQHFKATDVDPDGIDQVLAFDLDPVNVKLTDVSGLFAGESVTFPALPTAPNYPDVPGIIGRALASASSPGGAKPLTANGKTLALFRQASEAYKQPLIVEHTGTKDSRGFVVSCGASFMGLVSSRHQDDDSLANRDAWRRCWMDRLGVTRKPVAV